MASRPPTDSVPAPRRHSALPGRERWEIPALYRRPDVARLLEQALGATSGVLGIQANPVTGRALILFDPGVPDLDLPARLQELLRDLPPAPPPSAPGTARAVPTGTAQASGWRGAAGSPLARVIGGALPEKRRLLSPMLLSALGQGVSLVAGWSFVTTINTARGDAPPFLKSLGLRQPASRLAFMGLVSLVAQFANFSLQIYRRKVWQELAQETGQTLRTQLYAHLQEQDLELFHRTGTGPLLRLVTEETAKITEFIWRGGDRVMEKAVILVISGTVLLITSPMLTLMICLPIPLFLLPTRLLGPRAAAAEARQNETSVRFIDLLENGLAGIAEVKSFTAEPRELRRFAEEGAALAEQKIAADTLSTFAGVATEALVSMSFYAAAAYAGTLAAQGRMEQARYSWILFLMPRLLSVPAELNELLRLHDRAAGAARDIDSVLSSRPAVQSGPLRRSPREVAGEVVFDDVSFGYLPGHQVLHGVSFRIEPGQTLAIVGPTGSGKSTVLRLLLRLYDVQGGRILLDGIDLRELDLGDLRRAVSVVNQEVFLFHGTLRDNLRYGRPNAPDERILEALLHAGALNLVDTLPGGLDGNVGERGSRLSGGERQRVAIARALIKDAPILALDEATSHLDYETEAAVQRSMRQAVAGKSAILVAHRLATIRHADQILVLERGRIREQGRHDDLLAARGLYASLWDLQSGDPEGGGRLEVRVRWPDEE